MIDRSIDRFDASTGGDAVPRGDDDVDVVLVFVSVVVPVVVVVRERRRRGRRTMAQSDDADDAHDDG